MTTPCLQKKKDPRSFTLPCFIYNVCFDNALVEPGAIVSVMPFSTYTNLGLRDLAHTMLTVELDDKTIKHPRGIAENVLDRIGEAVNKSFDPHYGDYIELNDLDVPLEPKMNQDDNFEPTIDENDEGGHEGKKLAGTLIDMPIFVGKLSIISGFSIIDDMDVTSGVVLGMPFCKKFASCQKIMEKFERRDECKQIEEE
ncbi:hypothetical protein Tco_0985267 [Tanacetum coccineum]